MHELSDQLLQAEEKGHSNDSLAQEDKRPALLVTEALKESCRNTQEKDVYKKKERSKYSLRVYGNINDNKVTVITVGYETIEATTSFVRSFVPRTVTPRRYKQNTSSSKPSRRMAEEETALSSSHLHYGGERQSGRSGYGKGMTLLF